MSNLELFLNVLWNQILDVLESVGSFVLRGLSILFDSIMTSFDKWV